MYYTRSEQISRGNDVITVLVLNRISALIDLNVGNALRCAYFGCLPSVIQSFTKIYNRNFEISGTEDWTLCRQICYFLDVSVIRFANDPYTLCNRLKAGRLARF